MTGEPGRRTLRLPWALGGGGWRVHAQLPSARLLWWPAGAGESQRLDEIGHDAREIDGAGTDTFCGGQTASLVICYADVHRRNSRGDPAFDADPRDPPGAVRPP